MAKDEIFRKCFTCHSQTENKKSRRRGYAQSFCRLFNLPSLPYEDQLLQEAVFCKLCHENIREIENLYRTLEKVKEKILSFRILLENQLTKNHPEKSQLDDKETELKISTNEILPPSDPVVSDPSEELRTIIISKIQFTAVDDAENKTECISSSPITICERKEDDAAITDHAESPGDIDEVDIEFKTEVNWSPPASPLDTFVEDDETKIENKVKEDCSEDEDEETENKDKVKEKCSEDEDDSDSEDHEDDSDSDYSKDLHNKEKISVQLLTNTYTRRTTRSQTAFVKSFGSLDIKLENSCDEMDENPIGEISNASRVIRRRERSSQTRKKINSKSEVADHKKQKVRKKKRQEKILKRSATTKNWQCPMDNCKYRFAEETRLNAHIKRHHEGCQRPFTCSEPDCTHSYASNSGLKQHMLSVHSGERPFMCEFCAKTYPSQHLLRCHLRNIHMCLEDQQHIKCKYCDKAFSCNSRLKQHMWTHTKDYPFVCDACGKRFSTLAIFDMHKRAHNDEFKCSYCERVLASQASLDEHILKHTKLYPFKCSKCDFGACNVYRLNKHIKTHAGVKVECKICKKLISESCIKGHNKTHDLQRPKKCVCAECGKAFVDNYKLRRHEQYHRGEKPFPCTVCGKSFYTNDYLRIHMKYHEKSGASLRNQTRKPRIWKHSVLPNPNIEIANVLPDPT